MAGQQQKSKQLKSRLKVCILYTILYTLLFLFFALLDLALHNFLSIVLPLLWKGSFLLLQRVRKSCFVGFVLVSSWLWHRSEQAQGAQGREDQKDSPATVISQWARKRRALASVAHPLRLQWPSSLPTTTMLTTALLHWVHTSRTLLLICCWALEIMVGTSRHTRLCSIIEKRAIKYMISMKRDYYASVCFGYINRGIRELTLESWVFCW